MPSSAIAQDHKTPKLTSCLLLAAGTGLASYIPGTEANRAANTAPDQTPYSGRGSIPGTSIGSREAASEPTGGMTPSTPGGKQKVEYSHERHSSSVIEDAAGNVAGVQDGRQAEGRQAHQADATASETMRAGQSPRLPNWSSLHMKNSSSIPKSILSIGLLHLSSAAPQTNW